MPDYKKLILIKLDLDEAENAEEIEPDDATAKKFLSGSSSKVLSWSNKPKFWQSVRYYLPDPPRLPTKEGGKYLDISHMILKQKNSKHRFPPDDFDLFLVGHVILRLGRSCMQPGI